MPFDDEDPLMMPGELAAANARHDAANHDVTMLPHARLPTSWNMVRMTVRGELTDRKIAKYEKAGFYSADFRAARKAMMEKKKARKRHGNFVQVDDRWIYSPI